MPIEFTVDLDGVDQLVGRLDTADAVWREESRKAMVLSQHLVEAEAKALVPRVTGRLMASIGPGEVHRLGPEIVGRVGTRVHYAPIVEFGRGPVHAKRAKALRFTIGGKVIFRRSVGPAVPRPYMFPALEASKEGVKLLFERAVRNLRDHLGGVG